MPFYVITTFDSREKAADVGKNAVEAGFAACVSMIHGISSIYRWNGKIEESDEVMCVFKTSDERVAALEEFLRRNHNYEVPEIVAIRMDRVNQEYEKWIRESCNEKL
ncbi:divalent-cation tolerance protein CutA [Thermoplasma sp. Kam2015]|uniref:divalent-cation tolerance protein CutA n=1 Tax=Thermoplasma sp. Kam2015 TaxID=2094122 RepID=UPI000D95DEB7|nr:divalent-cation tolerance protein CutA [Thermoplasma sp. Kam2015]PYB69011.1 divalent-cation tolerance protein CutA [Thermoplasma sp. Kam2015]